MNRRDRQRIDDIVAAGRNVAEIASEGWPTFQRSWRSVSAACYEMVNGVFACYGVFEFAG